MSDAASCGRCRVVVSARFVGRVRHLDRDPVSARPVGLGRVCIHALVSSRRYFLALNRRLRCVLAFLSSGNPCLCAVWGEEGSWSGFYGGVHFDP